MNRFARLTLAALVLMAATSARTSDAYDLARAERARAFVFELDFDQAHQQLEATPASDTALRLELGRLLLYETRYAEAAEVLQRPDVAATEEGARLGELARHCAGSMAGAFVAEDKVHGVIVRMQDERDQVLVPILGQVVEHTRRVLERDLGVRLPVVRIELVRDHFSLSSMTGLPEKAARTTGTVAVANWGRVAMLSPRSTRSGYPWLDTLAHELAHLALGKATRDLAPLWMQEGIAKREETLWRAPDIWDAVPDPDQVAFDGMAKGLGRDLQDIGPSVAMLPTPEHARVVFAQVQSFVNFFVQRQGPGALADLVTAVRDRAGDADAALLALTGRDLRGWWAEWRTHLESRPGGSDALKASEPHDTSTLREASRSVRLAELLRQRGHHKATVKVLQDARESVPQDLRIRWLMADAMRAERDEDRAWQQLETLEPQMVPQGQALALRGYLLTQRNDQAGAHLDFFRALALDPWSEQVACQALMAPVVPSDDDQRALCEASRRWPRN